MNEQSIPLLRTRPDGTYGTIKEDTSVAENRKPFRSSDALTRSDGVFDEFGDDDGHPTGHFSGANKLIRTGRQRKRTAARTKGGEFQAKRQKKKVYFCCVGSEIDMERLADAFLQSRFGMVGKSYDEVLHLYMDRIEDLAIPIRSVYPSSIIDVDRHESEVVDSVISPKTIYDTLRPNDFEVIRGESTVTPPSTISPNHISKSKMKITDSAKRILRSKSLEVSTLNEEITSGLTHHEKSSIVADIQSSSAFWSHGGKEIFVFNFGAMVFWGFHKNEQREIVSYISDNFISKGQISKEEFEQGEDDMAFVTSPDYTSVTIANDVLSLPDQTSVKSRLAVSFAIAQSSVLSIFEARVDKYIEEYKYIPEVLAQSGKLKIGQKRLGEMIGNIFVIRHDVNLHSEILDIPDYFWNEYEVEPIYRMVSSYLELNPRTDILNKRLDLLRELLTVLQQQQENAHQAKLEWIVIWLIVVSILLDGAIIVEDLLRYAWDRATKA